VAATRAIGGIVLAAVTDREAVHEPPIDRVVRRLTRSTLQGRAVAGELRHGVRGIATFG
jgi:hypothetical protein